LIDRVFEFETGRKKLIFAQKLNIDIGFGYCHYTVGFISLDTKGIEYNSEIESFSIFAHIMLDANRKKLIVNLETKDVGNLRVQVFAGNNQNKFD
jgi:hypothetical protein